MRESSTMAPRKKSVAKRAPAKKAAADKSTPKKTAGKKKPPASKKAKSAKKTAPKKTTAKKSVAKAPVKKSSPKKASAADGSSAKKSPAKKAPTKRGAVTATDTYPFDAGFIEQQRVALLAERERYTRHAEQLKAEADQLAADREPGDVQFDDESGEGDSIAVERERDLAMSAQARQAVDDIDAALERITDGSYGMSVVSGLPIPRERLEAIPQADMRVDEKSRGMNWR